MFSYRHCFNKFVLNSLSKTFSNLNILTILILFSYHSFLNLSYCKCLVFFCVYTPIWIHTAFIIFLSFICIKIKYLHKNQTQNIINMKVLTQTSNYNDKIQFLFTTDFQYFDVQVLTSQRYIYIASSVFQF